MTGVVSSASPIGWVVGERSFNSGQALLFTKTRKYMKIRFLSKDGSRFEKDLPEPLPAKYVIERDNDPQSDPSIQKLARAIFDKRMSAEATRIGEGNPGRVLDIMWTKTKPQEREAALTEALALSVMMGSGQRTFRLHRARNGGQVYIELGAIFNELTTVDAPAPVKPVDEDPVLGKNVRYGGKQESAKRALDNIVNAPALQAEVKRWEEILKLEDKLVAEENLAAEQLKASKHQSAHIKDITGYAPGWNANVKL